MTDGTGVISGVSASHERASVDDIEIAAAESQRAAVESLLSHPGVEEAYVLQTCNRAEAYVVTAGDEAGHAVLGQHFEGVADDVLVEMDHEESLRHLLRVAAGLESIVLGEDQILGQVRDAYQDARGVGGIGPVLEDGITKAMHVGERARTETAINEGTVSLGSAAVNLARGERDLAEATALVVGAGEMGSLVAKALDGTVDRVLVANRTVPHAEHLVERLSTDGSALAIDAVPAAVGKADLVVTATGSPAPILDATDLATVDRTLVVDLAQPRDVPTAVAEFDHVTIHDLDDLESVTESSRAQRQEAAERVEAIVDEEFEHLLTQYKRKRADQVIAGMYESAERIKTAELNTAFDKLDDLDDEQREVVESMADALVSQLLAPPTQSLRDAAEEDDWTTINTALQLFDPDFGSEVPDFVSSMDPEDIPDDMKSEMSPAVLNQLDD
ncbi:glutamyl-tRNA reductase [Halorientalis marina]|uniref:glutamyl-tRNA reductase n=1 Tax=Halorientalis marina TaxID=2931976 RepID=UPI001FF1EBE5|nr:glutamyl-tRNA reductase [Halorientalis marina]